MTCAPELAPAAAPATVAEADVAIGALVDQVNRARSIFSQGTELPQLGYTEGDVTRAGVLITVPLATALASARLIMIPDVAERLAKRILEAVAEQRRGTSSCTCKTGS